MAALHIHLHGFPKSTRDGILDRIKSSLGHGELEQPSMTPEQRNAIVRWHRMVKSGEVQNTPQAWAAYCRQHGMDSSEEMIAMAKRNLSKTERTPEERIARAEKAIKRDIGVYRRTQAAGQSLKTMLARLDDCSCGHDADPAAEIAALKAELRTATDPALRRRLEEEIDTREWEVQMQRITRGRKE